MSFEYVNITEISHEIVFEFTKKLNRRRDIAHTFKPSEKYIKFGFSRDFKKIGKRMGFDKPFILYVCKFSPAFYINVTDYENKSLFTTLVEKIENLCDHADEIYQIITEATLKNNACNAESALGDIPPVAAELPEFPPAAAEDAAGEGDANCDWIYKCIEGVESSSSAAPPNTNTATEEMPNSNTDFLDTNMESDMQVLDLNQCYGEERQFTDQSMIFGTTVICGPDGRRVKGKMCGIIALYDVLPLIVATNYKIKSPYSLYVHLKSRRWSRANKEMLELDDFAAIASILKINVIIRHDLYSKFTEIDPTDRAKNQVEIMCPNSNLQITLTLRNKHYLNGRELC